MKNAYLGISLVILSLSFVGCVTGPKQEKKSAANYLSGEHYRRKASVLGVPVMERVVVQTVISGKVISADPLKSIATGTEVLLLRDGVVLGRAKTEADGAFRFAGDFDNGEYLLKVEGKKLKGDQAISVKSYLSKGIQLFVTENKG